MKPTRLAHDNRVPLYLPRDARPHFLFGSKDEDDDARDASIFAERSPNHAIERHQARRCITQRSFDRPVPRHVIVSLASGGREHPEIDKRSLPPKLLPYGFETVMVVSSLALAS